MLAGDQHLWKEMKQDWTEGEVKQQHRSDKAWARPAQQLCDKHVLSGLDKRISSLYTLCPATRWFVHGRARKLFSAEADSEEADSRRWSVTTFPVPWQQGLPSKEIWVVLLHVYDIWHFRNDVLEQRPSARCPGHIPKLFVYDVPIHTPLLGKPDHIHEHIKVFER